MRLESLQLRIGDDTGELAAGELETSLENWRLCWELEIGDELGDLAAGDWR